MKLNLSPLEEAILKRYAAKYASAGFPDPSCIRVASRENTGAGRFTFFWHEGEVDLDEGEYGLGEFVQIDMDGVSAGFSFWLSIANKRVECLELVVNGCERWDGVERPWKFVGDLDS